MKKILSYPPVSFAVDTAELFLGIGAPRMAAALSYFLILTLFPMLVCFNYFIGLFHLDLENLLQQQEAAMTEAGKPFEHEEDLRIKSARLAELDAELNLSGRAQETANIVHGCSGGESCCCALTQQYIVIIKREGNI